MAGASVPEAGEIGRDDIQNQEQEDLLEDLAESVRRVPGVGQPVGIDTYEISAGELSPGHSGIFFIQTEGSAAADNLDRISIDNHLFGSIIIVRGRSNQGEVVTMRHAQGGAGQLVLLRGEDFVLDNDDKWMMLWMRQNSWEELGRWFGNNTVEAREWLFLGSAALLDDGDVDAATLQGQPASSFLGASDQAADSALLAGLAATAFLRADLPSLQAITGSLQAAGGLLRASTPLASGAPQLDLVAAGVRRAMLFYDGVNGESVWRIHDADGTTVLGALRILDGEAPEWWDKDAAQWRPFFDPETTAPWLNHVRWESSAQGPNVQVGGESLPVLHTVTSQAIPSMPAGSEGRYAIRGGVRVQQNNNDLNDEMTYQIRMYAGENGDNSDPLVYVGPEQEATLFGPVIRGDFHFGWLEIVMPPDADFLTLEIRVTDRGGGGSGAHFWTLPSETASTQYHVFSRTYLHIDPLR